MFGSININSLNFDYPAVTEQNNNFCVESYHNQIRHQEITKVFKEDLRLIIHNKNNVNKTKIKYIINAKNLPSNIEGEITINIKN